MDYFAAFGNQANLNPAKLGLTYLFTSLPLKEFHGGELLVGGWGNARNKANLSPAKLGLGLSLAKSTSDPTSLFKLI